MYRIAMGYAVLCLQDGNKKEREKGVQETSQVDSPTSRNALYG
jgi:hypothetical protein